MRASLIEDCLEQQCLNQVCITPSCEDGVQNRDESDVDCGGQSCSSCSSGSECQANQDCQSDLCLNQTCVAPSCDDGIRNQDESDTDCGGKSVNLALIDKDVKLTETVFLTSAC